MPPKDKRKPIIEFNPKTKKIIGYWESLQDVAIHYKFHNIKGISHVVCNRNKKYKGHYFRYATPKEIKIYLKINKEVNEKIIKESLPLVETKPEIKYDEILIDTKEADIIPAHTPNVNKDINVVTNFDKMLQKSKIKFNEM